MYLSSESPWITPQPSLIHVCGLAGVVFKTGDETPRVIFYTKFLDWVITTPMLVSIVAILARAEPA
jgi:bacteriorhodopsin